jgi:hypothetical protein
MFYWVQFGLLKRGIRYGVSIVQWVVITNRNELTIFLLIWIIEGYLGLEKRRVFKIEEANKDFKMI